jgi:hypothetical protein
MTWRLAKRQASSASISNSTRMKVLNEILLLEPGGEIRIGDGAPGVNFTGLRIYKTSSGYRFETYDEDVLQVYLDEHGILRDAEGVASSDIFNSDNTWRRMNTFLSAIRLGDDATLGTQTFDASLIGSGLQLYQDSNGRWCLWVDKINARQSLTVSELLFMQKRTFNGSILIGRTGVGRAESMEKIH